MFGSGVVDRIFRNVDARCIVGLELDRNGMTKLRKTIDIPECLSCRGS